MIVFLYCSIEVMLPQVRPQKNPKCTTQLEIFFLSGHA